MTAIDLPPGLGLAGTPLGTFRAPTKSRRLALVSLIASIAFGAWTWWQVAHHPFRYYASTQFVLPVAFVAMAALGVAVRGASVAITRDGIRWGWTSFGFQQPASRIVCAHVYDDGVALEATRGSKWFLAARDWDRFDGLVRQLRRTDLPARAYGGKAPLRQRMQSYGRFLDGMLWSAMIGALVVATWAA
jgi:hypothetical protein